MPCSSEPWMSGDRCFFFLSLSKSLNTVLENFNGDQLKSTTLYFYHPHSEHSYIYILYNTLTQNL